LLVVIPAVAGARALRVMRVRVKATDIAARLGLPWWTVVAVFAVVAGAAVATFPYAAGNGMEALRQTAVGPTVAIAVALSVGKLIGTTASLGSGAPGGAISPSLSVAAGTALLASYGLDTLGLHPSGGVVWGALVASMGVGVAVGLRSPVLAVVLVPELVGDYTFLPIVAVVVIVARYIDLGVDRVVSRLATPVPDVIYDADA
jgi:CIC family chloride channel protein